MNQSSTKDFPDGFSPLSEELVVGAAPIEEFLIPSYDKKFIDYSCSRAAA
jgi:hypothetical protein